MTPNTSTPAELKTILIDRLILEIDAKVETLLTKILHHHHFKALESLWVGLHLLLEEVGGFPNIQIHLLDVQKETLAEDFEDNLNFFDSGLFKILYDGEFDQPGGEPFAALLLNYPFSHTPSDMNLLKHLAKIAVACHCPAIGNVSRQFFNVKTYRALEDIQEWDLFFESAAMQKWQRLRQDETSLFLGMVFPEFLVRQPYTCVPVRGSSYSESFENEEQCAWAFGTFAFAMVLCNSFIKHGWCVQIRGPESGGLVAPVSPLNRGLTKFEIDCPPLPITFSDQQERLFCEQGIILLNYFKKRQALCFFSTPTMHRETPTLQSGADTLPTSLPYIFLRSRIAHYQKVIQRDNIGSIKDASILERELQDWLKQLITQMPNASEAQRGKRPLYNAAVKVADDSANPGYFMIELVVQPHIQVEGANTKLTVKTRVANPD